MKKKILIWSLITLSLFVVIGFGVRYYTIANNHSITHLANSSTITPISALRQNSKSFVQAQKFITLGDYASARTAFTAALKDTTDSKQKALIEYKIANVDFHTGNTIASIQTLKTIATNTKYQPRKRAYAIQKMARFFHSTFDPAITQEIFNKPPFKALFVSGNTILSYQNLFEYGAHIYPLPVTELYLANMYAEHIGALYKAGATATSTSVVSDMKIIKDKFTLAGASLSSTTPKQREVLPPFTLLRKAITLGTLSHLKLASSSYAERSFKTALTAYDQFGNATSTGKDAKARYQYAAFLATTYGSARASDIQKIMTPLYTETSYTKSPITVFFKNAHGTLATQIGAQKNIQDIASNDPDFKAYLITLGWTDVDLTP